jgi:hypothetical protein
MAGTRASEFRFLFDPNRNRSAAHRSLNDRCWHITTCCTGVADGRFRGKADSGRSFAPSTFMSSRPNIQKSGSSNIPTPAPVAGAQGKVRWVMPLTSPACQSAPSRRWRLQERTPHRRDDDEQPKAKGGVEPGTNRDTTRDIDKPASLCGFGSSDCDGAPKLRKPRQSVAFHVDMSDNGRRGYPRRFLQEVARCVRFPFLVRTGMWGHRWNPAPADVQTPTLYPL